jgi:hypothetical protein
MQDGGDAFQGARAAAALEAIALVLALTFPIHRRRARFSSTWGGACIPECIARLLSNAALLFYASRFFSSIREESGECLPPCQFLR